MVQTALLFLLAALILALIGEPLSRWLRLPYSSLLVTMGIIAGQCVEYLDVDTGLRYTAYTDLVMRVLLPLLIYEATQATDLAALRKSAGLVTLLAIPGLIAASFITAYVIFGFDAGVSFLAALCAGALLSATDPFAIVGQLKQLQAPQALLTLVEGEGLFNDATAIVLFGVVVSVAIGGPMFDASSALVSFLAIFFGGTVVGIGVGWLGRWLLPRLSTVVGQALTTLIVAYASFLLGDALGLSGVMATLAAALVLDAGVERQANAALTAQLHVLWQIIGYIVQALLFLLVGFAFTTSMFVKHWALMLLAVIATLIARATVVSGVLGAANFFIAPSERFTTMQQFLVVWGGLRGGVTVAFALSLPLEFEGWFEVQSMAYGVVLFALYVQAPSVPWLVRRIARTQALPEAAA